MTQVFLEQELAGVDRRHLSLKFLKDTVFEKPSDQQMPPEEWCEKLSPEAYHVVFFNGRLVEDFCSVPQFHPGLEVKYDNGISLRLAPRTGLQRPIHIHYILQENSAASSVRCGFYLHISEDSRCEILETAEFLGGVESKVKKFFHLDRKISVAQRGQLSWLSLLETANSDEGVFDDFKLNCAEDSRSHLSNLFSGAGFQLSAPQIYQEGERSSCNFSTATLCYGAGSLAQKCRWTISGSSTEARQTFRSLTGDQGQTSFGGLIHIVSGLHQVDAAQQSRHLLLAEKAQAFATPELKIDSDDVKCSHGATISRLREEEELYLRTRGIDQMTARTLLAEGFIRDVFEGRDFSTYLKNNLAESLKRGLAGVFHEGKKGEKLL